MQDAVAVGVGGMAAILGMDAKEVENICRELTLESQNKGVQEVVEGVNFNDPLQTVIAGSVAGVNKACEVIKAMGAKRALILPVSAPFHSTLMKPAADKLKEKLELATFSTPKIQVINNVDVLTQTDPLKIKESLYRQAFSPVRWVETIRAMKNMGIEFTIESGPGKVLSGLSARIDNTLKSAPLYDPTTLGQVKELLATT
jgi:[acyl-carrier-protein] S-malonyltransferase